MLNLLSGALMYRAVVLVVPLIFLAACQRPDTGPIDLGGMLRPDAASQPGSSFETALLVPGGNYAMVTVRRRPDLAVTEPAGREIVCTAPSPDWATSLAMAQQIQGSGAVAGGPSASLSASRSLTDTVSALAGRTAGVVGLRDGLYRACEAYTNGVIGKDAYALILSQYGNLLVALAGTGAATPATAATAVTPAAGPAGSQSQMQMAQALLVACISENDPTVRPAGEQNKLLENKAVCQALLTDMVTAIPHLLPPPPAASNAGAEPAKPAAVKTLQRALIAKGAKISADGAFGPLTLAAINQYLVPRN